MTNPILEQMNRNRGGQQARTTYSQSQSTGAINNQNGSNPIVSENDSRLDSAKAYANQHGMTYKQAFFNICSEAINKNLNPMQILNKALGNK